MKYIPQKIALVGLSALSLIACESGSSSGLENATNAGATNTQVLIDATDANNFVYYKFDDLLSNKLIVVDEQADADWDIAFKATAVKLNGGVAGAGTLEGALAVPRNTYYNPDGSPKLSVFNDGRDPVAESQMTLAQVNSTTDLSALTFVSATESTAINGDWFTASRTGPTVIHSDKYWLLRSKTGDSYAKLRVISADNSGFQGALKTVKFGIQLQADGASSFAAELQQDITFVPSPPADLRGPDLCVDFDLSTSAPAAITVDCSTSNWDFKMTATTRDPAGSYAIRLNGGSTLGGSQTQAEIDAIADASTLSQGWSGDSVNDVFSDNSWYAYTGAPDHKILPNFRVYVIKDGASYYKLQVQSYYNSSGASRYLTVNVENL